MNNNKIVLGAVTLFSAVALMVSAYVYFSAQKTAYIDTGILLSKSNAVIEIKKRSEEEKKMLTARVDTLVSEFQKELKGFEKEMQKMSEKEKQLSRELLRNKQRQLEEYQQAVSRKAVEGEQAAMQEVMKKINAYIQEYSKKKGYDIVLATSNGNIAYANTKLDITEEIVAGINGSGLK